MCQRAGAVLTNAQPGADAAAAPIGSDQIAGTDRAPGAADSFAYGGGDARVVLREVEQLRAIAHVAAERGRPRAQDRLQHILGDQAARRRAGAGEVGAHVLHDAVELLADQALQHQHAAVAREERLDAPDRRLDPGRAQQLHRARRQTGESWMDGSPDVPLDQNERHAVAAEKERGRQPDQAAAHDQHRCRLIGGR